MSTYATTGTTTAPAGTTTTSGGRFGRKKKSGTAALAKNEAGKPATKYAEWRSKSGERWGVARAKLQERFSRMGADVSYGAFAITHPIHPVRRKAAKDAKVQKKALASERRQQQEAMVHSNAAAKRARAHEARVANLNQAVH